MKQSLSLATSLLLLFVTANAFAEGVESKVQTLTNTGHVQSSVYNEYPHSYFVSSQGRTVQRSTGFFNTNNNYRVDLRSRVLNAQGRQDLDTLLFYETDRAPHAEKLEAIRSARGDNYSYYVIRCKRPVDRLAGFWRLFYMGNSPNVLNQCVVTGLGEM